MIDIIISFIIIISLIFMIYKYAKMKKIIKKYKGIYLIKDFSGFEIAEKILESNDLDNIYIVETKNYIEENYDVKRKVIRLLPDNFHGTDIYNCLYASYLVGGAIKDKNNDKILNIRNLVLPFINILVYISYIVIMLSIFLRNFKFILIGVVLLFMTILFNIFTLSIEKEIKTLIIKEYKKLNYITEDNEEVVNEILSILVYRYIYNPIILIISLFK